MPIHPLASVVGLWGGRWSLQDFYDALTTETPYEAPTGETTPGPLAQTPYEKLATWCDFHDTELVDFRDLTVWPRKKVYDPKVYGWPKNKKRGQPYGSRPWEKTTCFFLHTTAVGGMGKNRGLGIPAHLYVPEEPAIVLLHQMERLVAHGHRANRFTVGCEVSGKSNWDTASQVERVRTLIRYFQACRFHHIEEGTPCYIGAHRQSHRSRVNDPGFEIWRGCGEWAIEELNFRLGPVVGSGRSIPDGLWV